MIPPRILAVLTTALVGLAACGESDREFTVREIRPGPGGPIRLGASSAERFGMPEVPSTVDVPGAFTFALPDGWSERPPSEFKEVDLRAPGGVEVWVSRLAGSGGGPIANLTRWRRQHGLGVADDAALAELPRVPLLGAEAFLVDLVAEDGSRRTVGLMAFRDTDALFVRMTGAPDAVEVQRGAFDRFLASLAESSTGVPAVGRSESHGLSWSAPASWFALTPSEFRVAQFRVAPDVDAWLTVLAGNGGGVGANLTRWCEQYGRELLEPSAIEALPRIPVLGQDAILVDLTGAADARGMLGVICELDERSVFVKMDGPSDAVRAHGDEFLRFCASLALVE